MMTTTMTSEHFEEAITATAQLVLQLNKARPYKTVEDCKASIYYYLLKLAEDKEASAIGTAGWIIIKSGQGADTDFSFYIDPLILGIS